MSISAANSITASTTEHPTRDARIDDDRASDFAGMLAGAVHSSAPKHEPKKAKEGTSELDKPEKSETEDDKKKVKRAKVRAGSPAEATADVSEAEVVQTTGALDPELQSKLARVAARMRDEAGHDVNVAETYRSQERQNTLFAQGREAPGPIVTWTRNSKHTEGRAVDVMLDGGNAGLDAYTTLQRIANEEGLRTLGARDPGHLELPGGQQVSTTATAATDVTPRAPVEPADAMGPGGVSIARIAQVAQLAQVAVERPAAVARVATVARPGAGGIDAAVHAAAAPHAQVATTDAGSAMQRSGGESTDKQDSNTRGDSSGFTQGEQRGGYGSLAAAVALRDAPPPHASAPIHSLGSNAALNPAERAAQIIAAYQDAPARPLSQITMNVDAGNGVTDKVQVAMRGSTLNAAIDAGDTRGAQAMTQ
ncbi:MAG: M15 family metallopeptidase, partial [Solirubrobacteraceae bacterium]